MSRRIEKINKNIQRIFGEVLQTHADLPPDVLVTVSRVETAPNLRSAAIWLYIFPLAHAPNTMNTLFRQLYVMQGEVNRRLATRPLPRLFLKLDKGAQHADDISRMLKKLE
jgi:ribosome-binding factor A